jgi:hypothetical protein
MVVEREAAAIDADFSEKWPPPLVIRLYASHHAFGRELHHLEGVWPEGAGDNTGNIVRGTLPLGPWTPRLAHSLAHIYTEWLMDRLTGNADDRQPSPAWLYDGIAEYEANRRSPPSVCALHGQYPLPLSDLQTRGQWWAIRAGPLEGFEYCEAEDAAARIIRRVRWTEVVRLLRSSGSWERFSTALGIGDMTTAR